MNFISLLESAPHRGEEHELVDNPQWLSSRRGRPFFFENLLPDRPEVPNRLRERFRARSAQAFDLLAEVGRDCVGAVQLLPAEADPPYVQMIEGTPPSEEAISHQMGIAGGLLLPGVDIEDSRISLAGAQEKTAFLWHEGQWHKPLGTTPSTHSFKLPRIAAGFLAVGCNRRTCQELQHFFGPGGSYRLAPLYDILSMHW